MLDNEIIKLNEIFEFKNDEVLNLSIFPQSF